MDGPKPTQALAAFAANLDPATLPAEVRQKLGWLLLDYLRVCSIGARLPWSDWARGYVGLVGRAGSSHVLFSPEPAQSAARDLPERDVRLELRRRRHPRGCDAASRRRGLVGGARGRRACRRVRAGGAGRGRRRLRDDHPHRSRDAARPFQARLPEHRHLRRVRHRGGGGRLLFRGHDAEQRIQDAIGLAGSYPSGVAQFYYSGSSGKRIQAAHAAQSGVAAALLTQQGFSGPADILEGAGGFARAYGDGWDPAIIEGDLGRRFHLMDVLTKSHAAAARVAAGIDGMLALRQRHGFTGDDIATLRLGIPRIIQGRLTNPHPVDLQAAQMCLPFSVALASKLALVPGRIPNVAVADYEAGLGDRSLYEIEERTTIELDDEVEAASNELSTAAKVSVRLRDGRELSVLVPAPKGSATNPFTAKEHEARFTQELSSRVSAKVCAEIIGVAKDLDRLDPRWLGRALSGA